MLVTMQKLSTISYAVHFVKLVDMQYKKIFKSAKQDPSGIVDPPKSQTISCMQTPCIRKLRRLPQERNGEKTHKDNSRGGR